MALGHPLTWGDCEALAASIPALAASASLAGGRNARAAGHAAALARLGAADRAGRWDIAVSAYALTLDGASPVTSAVRKWSALARAAGFPFPVRELRSGSAALAAFAFRPFIPDGAGGLAVSTRITYCFDTLRREVAHVTGFGRWASVASAQKYIRDHALDV